MRRSGSARKALFALVGAALFFVATACGSGTTEGSGSTFSGDTLTIADESQPLSGLDPIMAQAHDAKRMVAQFYEGLLRLGDDGKTVEPALAKEWTKMSPTKYKFKLRQGVTFHDGSPVTAEDVVFSLNRVVDPEQNSPYASLYRIQSVKATGSQQVTITLKKPQASLLRLLAQPWSAGIVSKDWITSRTASQMKTSENGTGPYKMDNFQEGSVIKTSAFKDYWGDAPEIKNVNYRVMPDEATRVQALQSGAINMTQVRLPKNHEKLKKAGFETGDSYHVGAYWLAMNTTKGPLKDERIRKAINLGVDRKRLVEIGSQGAGVLSGVVPPGDPFGSEVDDSMPYYEHDPDAAKKLLQDAGADNVELTLAIRSDSPEKIATAQLIKEQLSKIGVNLKIHQVEWSKLVNSIVSGDWDADLVQLTAALNADPSQYLVLWFQKGGAATKINDPKLWKMMAAAVETDLTDEQRKAAYTEINTYVAKHAYMLIPYAGIQVWEIWQPGLKFQTEPSSTRLMLKEATVR